MYTYCKGLFAKPFLFGFFLIVFFCFLGVAIYSNTFFSPFQFDDRTSIVENASIKDLLNIKAVWGFWPTRFMTYLSLALNYNLHRFDVVGYHAVNISIHLCTATLVWWLLLLTFSTPAMKGKKISVRAQLISFFAGAVFLVHPVQTQAVTYIIQRATSLATFFYVLSLCLYIKSRLLNHRLRFFGLYYFGSLLACALAMFTKEMTVTLPLVILLYEFYFLKEKKSLNWKSIIPFLLFLLLIPLAMVITKSVDFAGMHRISESSQQSAPFTYLLTEFRVMVTYLRLFFVPINQNLDYDYPLSKSLFEFSVIASIFLLISVLFVAVRMSRHCKLLSFSILWVFLTLLPESTIIPITDVIFEHRLYLPMVGYSFFLVTLLYYVFGKRNVMVMILLLISLVNWYALLTYKRNFNWLSRVSLWDDTVRKSPHKARPYFNRGVAYIEIGEDKKALADINKALMLYYQQVEKSEDFTETYNNLLTFDHGYARAYDFLGVKFAEINLPEMAVNLFKAAIMLNPENSGYYMNLSAAYGDLKKFKEAIEAGNVTIALAPDSPNAHYNLSVAYYFDGQCNRALKHLAIASQLGFQGDQEFVLKLKKTCEK